ncbi:helicase-related protein [Nodosilinea sp. AN01ver1]|uniref:helicase-related protein n=1 Tax=Nodosilinea sp. AN01ver1 TaxID=3423362 RepID=UPI003D3130BC
MQQTSISTFLSGIRDNSEARGSVGQFLQEKIKVGADLSVVSAYFTIYAFAALREQLLGADGLRFLFGEPRFIQSLDPEKTEKKAFCIEDDGLELSMERLQQRAEARECAAWMRQENVQIRSVRKTNFLHGKLYHIAQNGSTDAILGSSNFTVRGLGFSKQNSNIELNLEVSDKRDLEDLRRWFDELWDNQELVEDVKAQVLEYLEQLYQDHSPEFIYYKTLFHLFESGLTSQEESDRKTEQNLLDTQIWKTLFEFQKDGVKGAIKKILTYNGCVIADSVGLGKTYEALAVIKYFEIRNDKVLVLCPKKLRENWTVYQAVNNSTLNPFVDDRFSYTVLSHSDLSREGGYSGDINLETFNWANFDLVVIDESHNFRNNTKGKRDENGNVIRQSRYERLMEAVIRSGPKTKVLLLSATPVNNALTDLRNQLYFLTEGNDHAFQDSLGIRSLEDMLGAAQRTFSRWSQKNERHSNELLERLSSAFFKLLDELTIARSRHHIQTYYRDTIAELGGFPERLKPLSLFPDVDLEHKFMGYEQLNRQISGYKLVLFNPTAYVLPAYVERYNNPGQTNFRQSDREHFLIGMMRVNFLKRLESSVHAFRLTMERTVAKIEALEARIQKFQAVKAQQPVLDLAEVEITDLDDDDLLDAMQVGESLPFNLAHLDIQTWLKDLQADKAQLHLLALSAKDVTPERDAKLAELKRLIHQKVTNPTTNQDGEPNRKVLVFTAFADTAVYLYNNLQAWASELGIHSALVTGTASDNKATFGPSEFNQLLTNFSPRAKKRDRIESMPQEGEIDLLIATDCISEGQNLQDCDYLVNYDIHWNPVRIIQRFGRIDRIGSRNSAVQMVNFWPTEDLNQYIDLKGRVEARMALVDVTATGEDNLLEEDLRQAIEGDLKYRDQQLLRLKDEVLDLEDLNESVDFTDFTLDDFRIDLSKYIEGNRDALREAPMGLYAVVPPEVSLESAYRNVVEPGIIFCLRQRTEAKANDTINPLQPYFLAYVRDDGEVRYRFTQPKQILDIYRELCAGRTTPYEKLCRLFDRKTDQGANMAAFTPQLEQAVKSIHQTFKSRNAKQLQMGRGGLLVGKSEQPQDLGDFELITWLVLLAAEEGH